MYVSRKGILLRGMELCTSGERQMTNCDKSGTRNSTMIEHFIPNSEGTIRKLNYYSDVANVILSQHDHTNCKDCHWTFSVRFLFAQKYPIGIPSDAIDRQLATAAHNTQYYKIPSTFKAAACRVFEIDSLERLPPFLPSFLPSASHFVVLAPGTGEPISCPITVTISSASNLRSAEGPLTTAANLITSPVHSPSC